MESLFLFVAGLVMALSAIVLVVIAGVVILSKLKK
jgi:hypothetical protein